MELSLSLSEKDRFDLKVSCNLIMYNEIEVFVVNFYEAFLKPETLKFLQRNSNESLINMFTSFINIIFLYLDDPTLVDEQITALLAQHPNFKDMMNYADFFIEAFIKSLQKTLKSSMTSDLEKIWLRTVTTFVTYSKSKIS